MSDLFHENVPDWYIEKVFKVMITANWHTFQVLTKRADRMAEVLNNAAWWTGTMPEARKHIWLGVSVEDQKRAQERIPHLLKINASVRFLSCEPLLGPIDFEVVEEEGDSYGDGDIFWNLLSGDRWMRDGIEKDLSPYPESIQWVIVGGESGNKARPMDPKWAESIANQCRLNNVPFLFKQWGEWHWDAEIIKTKPNTRVIYMSGISVPMYRIGKHNAGRLLDGREWNEYPNEA
jgi:protein gp37